MRKLPLELDGSAARGDPTEALGMSIRFQVKEILLARLPPLSGRRSLVRL
jgi:hypothetical protein